MAVGGAEAEGEEIEDGSMEREREIRKSKMELELQHLKREREILLLQREKTRVGSFVILPSLHG